jgi:hypothetical protein
LITGGMSARGMTKPLVDEAITTISFFCPGAPMLFYRAALPLSRQTLTYVAGVIRRHRARIGSCWRKLAPGQQALLVLAHLRKGETFAGLAAGFGIGTATAWRYVTETVRVLAARAPKLGPALRAAREAGHAFVVIDGTLIPILGGPWWPGAPAGSAGEAAMVVVVPVTGSQKAGARRGLRTSAPARADRGAGRAVP